jgi:hypothetical protein
VVAPETKLSKAKLVKKVTVVASRTQRTSVLRTALSLIGRQQDSTGR